MLHSRDLAGLVDRVDPKVGGTVLAADVECVVVPAYVIITRHYTSGFPGPAKIGFASPSRRAPLSVIADLVTTPVLLPSLAIDTEGARNSRVSSFSVPARAIVTLRMQRGGPKLKRPASKRL